LLDDTTMTWFGLRARRASLYTRSSWATRPAASRHSLPPRRSSRNSTRRAG